ncbi:hypothetical protein, variant [Phialophora macrospora]|uniref:Uncharacterized protein n=1 Tax=Phialophora macrospora TaxID=1851006 RepID=A0A0D2FS50_9EURO|nr:hypothetical protein PV04_03363 [Phialophora macrospora]KIW71168.1 hypothetical protein, variant [Phialophora macrospora]
MRIGPAPPSAQTCPVIEGPPEVLAKVYQGGLQQLPAACRSHSISISSQTIPIQKWTGMVTNYTYLVESFKPINFPPWSSCIETRSTQVRQEHGPRDCCFRFRAKSRR